ncbi:hypothetical protein [Streptomyces acidicola]|uniref:DUF559 domain-containing protein n=1 Tax=Streptomyces acidicola TaxID=2596892 RepID=A0A5N8X7J6_9ACTN|nr:hypothetical protein [Streptomyces acidicola]MPY54968.1 hypothetical protein [Streptomyces acidicola]
MKGAELRRLVEGGVLLTSRALGAGWSRRALNRTLREGGWTQVRAGAWVEPGREVDWGTRLRVVQLLKPELVVSHRAAAALWRIETLGPALGPARGVPLEFIDPHLGTRREGGGVRVHRIPLAAREVVERGGLRVTAVNRTLADLLRAGPRDEALVSVDSALSRRTVGRVRRAPLTTPAALADALAPAPALGPPLQGALRALRWLELADPRSGSPAETIARLRMRDADLRPESQAELRTPDGRRRFLDFLFRAEGLGVEIEGYAYHGTRESHRRDVYRFNQVLQCPEVRTLLRFTAEDVFLRPAAILAEIRAALGEHHRVRGSSRP